MDKRFIILALCIISAYSLPVSQSSDGNNAERLIPDTGVINWPVVEDVIEKIEGIITNIETRSSLTPAEVEKVENILNKIEGIVNIHSARSTSDTGVINWAGIESGIEKVTNSLTPTEVDKIVTVMNKIEGIINIHSLETRSSLTPAEIENILNKVEGIVNIHFTRSISDTGVVNWPVVENVVDKIEGILTNIKTSSSLTPAEVDKVENILNKIEGIVNIHSARSVSDTGVINWPVVENVIEKIGGIVTNIKTRSSLTTAQVDQIVNVLNKIEGIINIHSLETRSSLTPTEIENILNKIEGIVNIHSLEIAPEPYLPKGVVNVPVVIDVVNKIQDIAGSLKTRATLTSAEVENIIEILNKIEGIINIH